MILSFDQSFFLVLILVSHITASLFLAKPRFGKVATATIWMIYTILFLLMPPDNPPVSFFLSLVLHSILFFLTTKGQWQARGFLFFSYASIFTCFCTTYNFLMFFVPSIAWKVVWGIGTMLLMQALLYAVLLPSFRKVLPYIHTGWGKFYAVVLSFMALIMIQLELPTTVPFAAKDVIVFALTMLAFCVAYTAVFTSMKNVVELAREKRRQLHAELLLSQVEAQAKEATAVRQNRHDMRHHYQMLLSYANSGDMEKITDYLNRQTERIESLSSGRFCENETVNSILRVYHQKAETQNIAMNITAAAKPELSAAVPDLVAIIANVLENALHGAAKSGSETPFIDVTIKHKAQRLVVSCDNSCDPSMAFDEMPGERRGIGIQSITATAERYNGSCLFSAKDGVFSSVVIMDE
ncbi:MAG: GHKL domain-containing protein [Clostridia bacterium]|nr:GHKL domain-containing protein [Clostridia bacterium]